MLYTNANILPYRAREVADLQDRTFSIYEGKERTELEKTINRLKDLQKVLEASERGLYERLGLKGNLSSSLKELQNRLDSLNADPGFKDMINLDGNNFDNLVSAAMKGVDWTKPITAYFTNKELREEFLENAGIVRKVIDGAVTAQRLGIEEFIRSINRANGFYKVDYKGGKKRASGYLSTADTSSLISSLGTITVHPYGRKNFIEFQFKSPIPNRFKDRLEKDFGLIIDTKTDPYTIIYNHLKSTIKNKELFEYVEYQMKVNKDKYDLFEAESSIKGYLGEVHNNAAFDYILKQKGATIPTGKLRYDGEEIHIDSVLDGFGFQVKNYREKNGTVDYNHSMQAGNFVVNRLRPNDGVAEILTDFFGSYAYNQPALWMGESAREYGERIYNRFTSEHTNQRMGNIFNMYLDHVINIEKELANISPLFSAKKEYFNTIFVFNQRLVPSSCMVAALIEQLQDENNISFNTSYKLNKIELDNPGSNSILKNSKTKKNPTGLAVYPSIATGSSFDYANKVKISYNIVIQIKNIAERAMNLARI